jgi:hypothetical protein
VIDEIEKNKKELQKLLNELEAKKKMIGTKEEEMAHVD